ncbi:MAG: ATP-binding cassette domain-containing protein [Anaerolineae bacterium]|nr:ATP-binding cassette domain-containing protein [Anaerolineae bacterium]
MLQLSSISKSYGDNLLFLDVSFIVNPGDRVGLVGPNGCGKTTLLRIIVGEELPDGGSVRTSPPDLRIGYLGQGVTCAPEVTVADYLGLPSEELAAAEERVAAAAMALAASDGASRERLVADYDRALADLERIAEGAKRAREAAAVLAGLGLQSLALETRVAVLSGGHKTRLGLARLLLDQPQLLLLDEPTNHLDFEALEWLEAWLRGYRGAALIVSHDRTFLDRTVSTILDLDPLTHKVTAYPGNYSEYVATKLREREKQWAAYKDQQERVARVQEDIRRLSAYAASIERGTLHYHQRKIAKGIARRAVVQRRRLDRELEETRVEKPALTWHMKLEFDDTPESGREVAILEGVAAGYGGVPVVSEVSQTVRAGERVALVGPNGSGKTTLLRVLAGELEPLAGRVRLGAGVRVGYYAQEQEVLDPAATPFEVIAEVSGASQTEIRTFLHRFLFTGDEVFLPVGDLSFGERARLVLARLVATGCNLLLLDEPINHLDIPSRASFEQAIALFAGTVLAAVHDRYFIQQFASRIWHVSGGRVTSYLELEDLPRR